MAIGHINVVTVWIALTNSDKKSGALELVPNSHNFGIINTLDVQNPRKAYLNGEKTTSEKDLLSYKQNLDEFLKKHNPEIVELKPGDYSIHHVNTVHGSGVNYSNNYRIGFALRYISSDTKHKEESQDSAVHVCGEKNSYFIDEKRPTSDFSEEAVDAYKKTLFSAGAFGNKILKLIKNFIIKFLKIQTRGVFYKYFNELYLWRCFKKYL